MIRCQPDRNRSESMVNFEHGLLQNDMFFLDIVFQRMCHCLNASDRKYLKKQSMRQEP
jgi:hypothetical protein